MPKEELFLLRDIQNDPRFRERFDFIEQTPEQIAELKAKMKGEFNGYCNRTACQKPGATWWNRGTYKHYCRACAMLINRAGDCTGEESLCSERTA